MDGSVVLTQTVRIKAGWVGQVWVGDEIAWESAAQDIQGDALDLAVQHVTDALSG